MKKKILLIIILLLSTISVIRLSYNKLKPIEEKKLGIMIQNTKGYEKTDSNYWPNSNDYQFGDNSSCKKGNITYNTLDNKVTVTTKTTDECTTYFDENSSEIDFGYSSSYYKSSDYKDKIKNVYFVDYKPSEEELQNKTNWDLSKKKNRSIIGWLENNSGDEAVPYNLYIGSSGKIKVTSYHYALYRLSKVETIDLNSDIVNTNGLSSTSSMFDGCSSLTEIKGIEDLDVSNVTNMYGMFYNASSLTKLDLSSWDTHSVTDMSDMFDGARSLTTIGDISGWDTSKVENMSDMFRSASSLTTVGDISNWDTHSVTDMSGMFYGADSSIIPDISNWNTANVKDMSYLFSWTTYNYDVSKIDTHNVTNMSEMFSVYEGTKILGIENLDTSSVTDMSDMFSQIKLESLDLSNWDTSKVENMSKMFRSARGLTELNLSTWDTSSVTDMSEMFRYANKLTTIDMTNATFRQLEKYTDMFSNTNSELKVTINKDELGWFTDNSVLAIEHLNY